MKTDIRVISGFCLIVNTVVRDNVHLESFLFSMKYLHVKVGRVRVGFAVVFYLYIDIVINVVAIYTK